MNSNRNDVRVSNWTLATGSEPGRRESSRLDA